MTTQTFLAPGAGPAAGIYRDALRRTLIDVPYSSASEFHRAHGDGTARPRLGAVCIRQTLHAADLAVGARASDPLLLQDGRHVAAVFVDGDVVVLDPYLLHFEPLIFPEVEVRQGSSAVTVEAAPARIGSDGSVRPARLEGRYAARPDGEFVIRLSYSRYSPRLDRYVLARHFSLRSHQRFEPEEFAANITRQLTHPEQTSMSLRAFDPEQHGTIEAILPLAGFAGRTFARDDIWLRGPDGRATPGTACPGLWSRLEFVLGVEADQISDHLLGAGAIYQRIADPADPVAPYDMSPE